MLSKLYELIDLIWKKISNLVFVRFAFDFPEDRIPRNEPTQQLVFSLTHGGIVEWLLLSSWCRKNGLGAILVANRRKILLFSKPLIFLQVVFLNRSFSDIFLSEEPGPRLIFCNPGERKELFKPTEAESLIASLYENERKNPGAGLYRFVPVFICWRKHVRGGSRQLGEYFLGLSSNPNILGKIWYLARKRTDSTVRALSPIFFSARDGSEVNDNLDELDSNKIARMVRRKIIVAVNQEMRVILGPRYFSPVFIKETIMRDPDVLKLVEQISQEQGIDRKKVMGQAYHFLTEISANYKFRFIEVMYVVLTWLFKKIFEELVVVPKQIQDLRETLKTKSVVFVSCHRSHLDYLVVPEVLFVEDIVTPHIAAGVNLSFWPVGPFLRMGGAFFIRRTFRGEPLYSLCLQKYIEWLIKNRINIKFFIEGTRSRTGKMLPPAYGLLKMILQTYEDRQVDDIALVPVSISYDEVFEERTYGKELAGAQKERESAKGLIRSRSLFKRNLEKVYVRFAPSLSLKAEVPLTEHFTSDSSLSLQKLAFQLCKSINDVTPITPKSVLSSVLISHEKTELALEDILRASDCLVSYVTFSQFELSVSGLENDFKRSIETGVKKLLQQQVLIPQQQVPIRYSLEDRQRINLIFYKNNALHCFNLPSIVLLAGLSILSEPLQSESMLDGIKRQSLVLRNLLKFEFFFSPTQGFLAEMEKALSFLCQDAPLPGLSVADFRNGLKRRFPELSDASVLLRLNRDILESYLITFEVLRTQAGKMEEQKFLLQHLVREGVRRVENNENYRPECVSTQNFTNALKLMENLGLVKTEKAKDAFSIRIEEVNSVWMSTLECLKHFHELVSTPIENHLR